MGSLGRQSAVAEVFGVPISGFVAWFPWRTIYLMKMPGWGRRLKVAASWTLDLVLPPELVQLRLGSSVGVTQELPKREFRVLSTNLPELRRSFEAKSGERVVSEAPQQD
jgi:hypothetical protein